MEKKKAKMGMSALLILAIVFVGIGIPFLMVGIITLVAWGNTMENVVEDLKVITLVFGSLGILFLGMGILFLSIYLRKRRKANCLLQEGYYVMAEVVALERNWNVSYGRCGHPFIIKCSYMDYNGTIHIFRSRNITRYPGNDLEGQLVKVYLDRNAPDNYKNYYMDVDEILQNVVEH